MTHGNTKFADEVCSVQALRKTGAVLYFNRTGTSVQIPYALIRDPALLYEGKTITVSIERWKLVKEKILDK